MDLFKIMRDLLFLLALCLVAYRVGKMVNDALEWLVDRVIEFFVPLSKD